MKIYAGFYADGELATFPVCQECVDDNLDGDIASYREIVCTVHNRDEDCAFCGAIIMPIPDGGPRGTMHEGFGNHFDYADEALDK